MANVCMIDPQGHVCDLVVQDQELKNFTARKLAAGWRLPDPIVDPATEDSADEGAADSDDAE